MKVITIHGKDYTVNDDEFIASNEFTPLKTYSDVPELDREIALLKEIHTLSPTSTFIDFKSRFGYYVGKSLVDTYTKVLSVKKNIPSIENVVLRIEKGVHLPHSVLSSIHRYTYIITDTEVNIDNFYRYRFYNRFIYVNNNSHSKFTNLFQSYIHNDELNYDNLINLLIMVKNAGDGFREILEKNLPYVDRWTFLDTGSTDNTIEIIKDVMKSKRGTLYQEPFINFRDSRNRLLDLAGENCVFNVMIDDTYVLNGDLRTLLTKLRSAEDGDVFSIYIKDVDMMYMSARITRSTKKKRYIYTIHEIIEGDAYSLPQSVFIQDVTSPYMRERTVSRKQMDLDLIQKEIETNPNDARLYYYLAETYLCMYNWKKAAEAYEKRSKMEGFFEERQNALYKKAVMHHFHLDTPWSECHEMYLDAYRFDPSRPEGLFIIGYHYATEDVDTDLAYMYLRQAFEVGVPDKKCMNINTDMYYKNISKYLIPLCYERENWELGYAATERTLSYCEDDTIGFYHSIFHLILENKKIQQINQIQNISKTPYDNRKVIAFVAPGGWKDWSGKTLDHEGLGGSETCVIRFAETIMKNYDNSYKMVVFCKCGSSVIVHKNVVYVPLQEYLLFINTYKVDMVFIHRYTEFIPVTRINNIPHNIILHDLTRSVDIFDTRIPKIICLSNYHKQHVIDSFPAIKDRVDTLSYGIEVNDFFPQEKIPCSFIYSSFPNRGLYHLLKMWPKITELLPSATLNIFCDTKHKWVRNFANDEMEEIEEMINSYHNVTNHGWVDKKTLYSYWSKTHIWLYPTEFVETCCLTAYEAAASRTLMIASNLAALKESVGDRGILIDEWNDDVLVKMKELITSFDRLNSYLNNAYDWVSKKSYDNVVEDFVNRFVIPVIGK